MESRWMELCAIYFSGWHMDGKVHYEQVWLVALWTQRNLAILTGTLGAFWHLIRMGIDVPWTLISWWWTLDYFESFQVHLKISSLSWYCELLKLCLWWLICNVSLAHTSHHLTLLSTRNESVDTRKWNHGFCHTEGYHELGGGKLFERQQFMDTSFSFTCSLSPLGKGSGHQIYNVKAGYAPVCPKLGPQSAVILIKKVKYGKIDWSYSLQIVTTTSLLCTCSIGLFFLFCLAPTAKIWHSKFQCSALVQPKKKTLPREFILFSWVGCQKLVGLQSLSFRLAGRLIKPHLYD